ncbi:MAG: anaerobic sulfite reductase subunit AsrA [Bilifractor sp.]
MGYTLDQAGFAKVIKELDQNYRLFAPVLKVGEGRFTDTDVIRYDFIHDSSEIELRQKSDYSFKEILTPLSETLFFFTENEVKEADRDTRDVIVFLRSYDIHAVKRLDQIYLGNGPKDYFYENIRNHVKFALIAGEEADDPDGFSVSMGTNRVTDGYLFSVEQKDGAFLCDVPDTSLEGIFENAGGKRADITPSYPVENKTKVEIPEEIPNSIYKDPIWDEYTARCIGCGRCTLVCPTCTCFTMQDIYYTDNGKVGERRRVNASCMVDGYTNVAGGGQYRRTQGERMRFKVLHKIYDFRTRFGYNMCVGCGRCDAVCPEYISYSKIINKVNQRVKELAASTATGSDK